MHPGALSRVLAGAASRCRTSLIAALCAVAALFGCGDATGLGAGTGASSGPATEGLYLGTDVSFRMGAGMVYDFRFSHIECRIPHPENEAVALCLLRPDGQPDDVLNLNGNQLQGLVGELELEGVIDGDTASGTWHYEATCFDGTPCESDGEWSATWKAEPGGSDPTGPLGTPEDESPVGEAAPEGSDDAGDSGTGESEARPGQPADEASELQLTAWEAFEAVRVAAGIDMPDQDDGINAAAQAHADYFSFHAESYYETGLNPHSENSEWEEGFSGEGIGDRLSFHGVTGGSGWGEVMAFTGSAQGAVHGWMDTLYHRIPFVHPNTARWGFGIAAGDVRCEVMDYTMGPALAQGASIWPQAGQLGVAWPVPGAEGVDRSWNGAESPQPPLPDGASYPSGPIITLTFANGTGPALTAATLSDATGPIAAQVQSPENDSYLSTTFALYALDPLQALTTYTVEFEGTVNGEDYVASWSFVTGS